MNLNNALGIARILQDEGWEIDAIVSHDLIPEQLKQTVRNILEEEAKISVEGPAVITEGKRDDAWLDQLDRSHWHYWPKLRSYLLSTKNWPTKSVRSIDETTDRILGLMANPDYEQFNIRGLVLGYVQSGKTANYTALIAKAVDVGYRLVIVLAGLDNGLRRQTQIRLNKELVGYVNNPRNAVPLPPMGKQWHQLTTEDIDGDFRPGHVNYGQLQGSQPVLLVIKKNSAVLRRLAAWIDKSPEKIKKSLPVLVIDDEADQASVDTTGTYQTEDENGEYDEVTQPSTINRLIRDLLNKFDRTTYVAYTATPYANILIPHDLYNPEYQEDLYPKDFIIDLPKPDGYFGAEELFGRLDTYSEESVEGLDVILPIPDDELDDINEDLFPPSMLQAIKDFILAGAGRHAREDNFASTMLIHVTRLIMDQNYLSRIVGKNFNTIKDEWRYDRHNGLIQEFRSRWELEFRPLTRQLNPDLDISFEKIEKHITSFIESIRIKTINSNTGDILDFEQDPYMKAIAIGGDKLSRGLTIEGLQVSYFHRPSKMYDTLMQMGRWFGFRSGYEDLTRIYLSDELSSWFRDLALVEHELRQDIRIYEQENLTPRQVSARIRVHPGRMVTNRAKSRYATTVTLEQSYSGKSEQIFRFPFTDYAKIRPILRNNLQYTEEFLSSLNSSGRVWKKNNRVPVWRDIPASSILDYLQRYQLDDVRNVSLPLIVEYIKKQNRINELSHWSVVVLGRESPDPDLGDWDINLEHRINLISRTRLRNDATSMGVITSPGDEAIDLADTLLDQVEAIREEQAQQGRSQALNVVARRMRPAENGLLLIYPISKYSGHQSSHNARTTRFPLFEESVVGDMEHVISLVISFPYSRNEQTITAQYVHGTAGWRPVDAHD